MMLAHRWTMAMAAAALAACGGPSQPAAPAPATSAGRAVGAAAAPAAAPSPAATAVDALLADLTTGCPEHSPRVRWCPVASFDRGTHDGSLDGRAVLFGFTVWLDGDRTVDAALEHEALSALVVEPRGGGRVVRLAPLQGIDEELEPAATEVRAMFEPPYGASASIPHALWATVEGWRADATDSIVASAHGWTVPEWLPQTDLELRRVGTVIVAIARTRAAPVALVGVFTDQVHEARAP